MNWVDETTYSQDQERREPRILSLASCYGVKITLRRIQGIGAPWICTTHCRTLVLRHSTVELESRDLEQAKEEALRIVYGSLLSLSDSYRMAAYQFNSIRQDADVEQHTVKRPYQVQGDE